MKKCLFIFLLFFTCSFIFAKNTAPIKNSTPPTLSSVLKSSPVSETTHVIVKPKNKSASIDLKEVFSASPVIYSILFFMSVTSVLILLYNSFNFRPKYLMSQKTIEHLKQHLYQEKYQEALVFCDQNSNLLSSMVAAGISARKQGPQYMIDSMKDEGRRVTAEFWQKLTLLNEIAVISPMVGLCGTVIGMFYAFYDINRSIDSIAALFDGLGIAVGTTVAGLLVSIVAMLFHTALKYRMIKFLHLVESEAALLANLINTNRN